MKIYTKTGDNGTTSIVGGSRLPKNAPRIEAYGTVDELNSAIGLLTSNTDTQAPEKELLLNVQNTLLNIGGYLAGMPDPKVSDTEIKALESSIDIMDKLLPPLHNFILPGGCPLAAQAHVARTICRRAERRMIDIVSTLSLPAELLAFINRLSDWLYTFARYANAQAEVPENFWRKP